MLVLFVYAEMFGVAAVTEAEWRWKWKWLHMNRKKKKQ
jgi:hypothetical protein